jgi:nitrile hydratase
MDGIHDTGGKSGYGPVQYQKAEPVFHYEWEGRALSILTWMHLKGISWWDKSRFFREQMGNQRYVDMLRDSYYTHWLDAAERMLVADNIITEQERRHRVEEILDGSYEERKPSRNFDSSEINAAIEEMHTPRSLVLEGPKPSYKEGDRVQVKNMHPSGHTRCPEYVRNHVGEIAMSHGPEIYPDSSYAGLGDDPKPVYTVGFSATDLWGEKGNPQDTVYVDLWEPYLTPAAT